MSCLVFPFCTFSLIHGRIPQQQKMAKYLKQYLGGKIAPPPVQTTPGRPIIIPSPHALRHKVLIKGKRLPKSADGK